MGQFYSLLWDACGFWSLTNCGCGLQKKKKPHPAWVFLRKMPEKQLILFAWPKRCIIPSSLNNCIEVLLLMLLIAQIMIILRSEPMKIKRQFQRDI